MIDERFYKKTKKIKLTELLDHIHCKYEIFGKDLEISDLGSLKNAVSGDISVCYDKKSVTDLRITRSSACLLTKSLLAEAPSSITIVAVENPRVIFAKIAAFFYPNISKPSLEKGAIKIGENVHIAESAIIGCGVEIGENTTIGPNAHIGDGVKIGKNCIIYDNVTIYKSLIGDRVVIKSGARIGLHGFGFELCEGKLIDIPHLGRVIIGDNVYVGANTCIDRGVIDDTTIGSHVRIDNLVQIAHNVKIGNGCIIVSQVGIAGSTEIGDGTVLAGQAGLTGHLKIGKNVKIAAQSGVLKDIPDGQTVGGSPSMPIKDWHRQTLFLMQQIKKKF